jgi:hypothetical protein
MVGPTTAPTTGPTTAHGRICAGTGRRVAAPRLCTRGPTVQPGGDCASALCTVAALAECAGPRPSLCRRLHSERRELCAAVSVHTATHARAPLVGPTMAPTMAGQGHAAGSWRVAGGGGRLSGRGRERQAWWARPWVRPWLVRGVPPFRAGWPGAVAAVWPPPDDSPRPRSTAGSAPAPGTCGISAACQRTVCAAGGDCVSVLCTVAALAECVGPRPSLCRRLHSLRRELCAAASVHTATHARNPWSPGHGADQGWSVGRWGFRGGWWEVVAGLPGRGREEGLVVGPTMAGQAHAVLERWLVPGGAFWPVGEAGCTPR